MKRHAWTGSLLTGGLLSCGLLMCGPVNFAPADEYHQSGGEHAAAGEMSALPGSYADHGGGCASCGQGGGYGGCAPWNPTCCRISKRESVMPNLWGDYCASQFVYDRCDSGCGGIFGGCQDWSQNWEAGWHGSCCRGAAPSTCGGGCSDCVSDSCGTACAPPAPCRARMTWNFSWCRNWFGLGREDWNCQGGCGCGGDEFAGGPTESGDSLAGEDASAAPSASPMPMNIQVPAPAANDSPALAPTPAPEAEPMPLSPANDDSV